jgi:hypothetical protein
LNAALLFDHEGIGGHRIAREHHAQGPGTPVERSQHRTETIMQVATKPA